MARARSLKIIVIDQGGFTSKITGQVSHLQLHINSLFRFPLLLNRLYYPNVLSAEPNLFSEWFIFFTIKVWLKTQKFCLIYHQTKSYKDIRDGQFSIYGLGTHSFCLLTAFQSNLSFQCSSHSKMTTQIGHRVCT